MVASDFDGLRGYRTLEYEGQVPTKPYNCCFSRVFQASVCIATYGMSVPSVHTESTDCDTRPGIDSCPFSLKDPVRRGQDPTQTRGKLYTLLQSGN